MKLHTDLLNVAWMDINLSFSYFKASRCRTGSVFLYVLSTAGWVYSILTDGHLLIPASVSEAL